MAADGPLRLVVVTPEKTVLDQDVTSLRFALYDGQIGILPGTGSVGGAAGLWRVADHGHQWRQPQLLH